MFKSKKSITGTVIIKIIAGEFTKDTEWIGKMDPFVIIKIGENIC